MHTYLLLDFLLYIKFFLHYVLMEYLYGALLAESHADVKVEKICQCQSVPISGANSTQRIRGVSATPTSCHLV